MTTIDIVIPIIVGLGVGVAFSYLFTKYSSVNSYSASIFGINANALLSGILLFTIVGGIAALAGMSVVIKDFEYPSNNPVKFFFETLLMGLLPALAVLFVIYCRKNYISSKDNMELFIITGKFVALHLLLQFSGYYRYVFE